MRYILDNDGYVELFSATPMFCNGRGCTEYTGEVPVGYESVEDWAINANIRAYKIVDGNLVYDPNRCSILEAQYEKEAEDNRYVCHKEISNITNIVKTDSVDAYKRSTTGLSYLLEVTDSNKFASEYIKLVANENLTGSVTLKFNNGNLLTNDATSKYESGIYFIVNPDRSITIDGIATEDIEFNIAGTNTSTKTILALKKNTNYYLSSNDYQIKMYNYDGEERTEIYNGTGGIINLSSNSKITNIVLAIPNGTTINETIYPMLNVGTEANEYITYQGNETTIYLGNKTFDSNDNIKVYDGIPILQNEIYIGDNITIGDDFTIGGSLAQLEECVMPYTYLDKTYMYGYDDIDLIVTYPNTEKALDLCGYETPNSGFGVDEEGNMYANNGTFRGNIIGSIFKGANDSASYIKIGNNPESGSQVEGFLNLYSANGNLQLSVGELYEGTQLEALRFYSPDTRFFEFVSGADDERVNANAFVAGSYMYSPAYNGGSLESIKKNITLYEKNCVDIIKNADIYSYNLKNENDDNKKHIGLVIGDLGNDYKTPEEVINQNQDGIDLYSMISIAWKSIKEQQNLIEELKEEIKQLKESDN